MKRPPTLEKGDTIAIAAPARKISAGELKPALEIMEERGFKVHLPDGLFSEQNQYAGSDEHRAILLQNLLDDPKIKAVFFARGGYGSVRIIDKLDFSSFQKNPKWLVGYSDITVFHSHINRNLGIETLHASMPINFGENSRDALDSLFGVLSGQSLRYEIPGHPMSRPVDVNGEITGGNLSVLFSLLGSESFPETDGKILFIEDLDEYLYHIDRMMQALKRAGKLQNLAALLVGGMTDMNDNTVPFGKTAEEIIIEAVEKYNYPVFFGFPAGHSPENRAIIMGARARIQLERQQLVFTQ